MKVNLYASKFIIWISLFGLCVSFSNEIFSQSILNYTFSSSSGTFTALSSGTTNPGQGTLDEGAWNSNPIGFDFWYMGTRYTTISASTNGWLALGSSISSYGYVNSLASTATTNATVIRPILAPLWDDHMITSAASFTYQTSGAVGSRVFTAEFLNQKWQYSATSAGVSFQVKLYEGTGKIEFIYRPESGSIATSSASIGITGNASGSYLSLNGAGTSPTASSSSETTNINAKPASGQKYTFTPPVPAAPSSLTITSIGGSSMTLNWIDNSTNESGFVVYRSSDGGATYEYFSQAAAGATSAVQQGLLSGTTFHWRVYAVSEGALSTGFASGSATTTACTGTGGVTRTWTGAGSGGSSTNFNLSTNWNPAGTPSCADSLIMTLTSGTIISLSSSIEIGAINASISGSENVFRLNTGAYSLQVNNTAYFNVASGNNNTQVQINVEDGGSITYNKSATFSAAVGGSFPILGLGNTSGIITFKGDVTFNSGSQTNVSNQLDKVIFDGTGTQILTCNNTDFYMFLGRTSTEIGSANSPTVILAGSTFSTPYGNLNINGTSTLDMSTKTFSRYASGGTITLAAGATLKLAGSTGGQTGSNFPSNFTSFSFAPTSNVYYNSASGVSQTIYHTPAYGNLILSNKTGSGSTTKSATGNLSVVGNFTINDAYTTFNAGTSLNHSLQGNWINNGAAGTGSFTYTTANTITFTGTSAQSIQGTTSTTFYNLLVNKSSQNLTLNIASAVANLLTLTSGKVITSASNLLTLNDNATSAGASNNSYVQGPMRKIGNDAFSFPVGKSSYYRPIAISAPGLTSDHFTAEYFSSNPCTPYGSTRDAALNRLSQLEYWILDRTNGTSNVNVTLSWNANGGVKDLPNLRVARWNGTQWKDHGNGGTTGDTLSGTVVTSAVVTSFSPFTLASASSTNPLPLELLNFSAKKVGEHVLLEWSTASEIDNDYFMLERSADGVTFYPLVSYESVENSYSVKQYEYLDTAPIKGISYYRIKQKDFKENYNFSKIVSLNYTNNALETQIVKAYYNSGSLKLNIYSESSQNYQVSLYEITGKKVISTEENVVAGSNEININLSQIKSGIYNVVVQNQNSLTSQKILINQ